MLKDVCRDMCARACDTKRWIETSAGMRVCASEERARARERQREKERARARALKRDRERVRMRERESEEREGRISTHHHHRLHHFFHARSLATHTALQEGVSICIFVLENQVTWYLLLEPRESLLLVVFLKVCAHDVYSRKLLAV